MYFKTVGVESEIGKRLLYLWLDFFNPIINTSKAMNF